MNMYDNLLFSIKNISSELIGFISKNLDFFESNNKYNFHGMNILNCCDIDILLLLVNINPVISDEEILDRLLLLYGIGNSIYNCMEEPNAIPKYLNKGFIISNVKLLMLLGHPKFSNPVYIKNIVDEGHTLINLYE